MLKKPESERCMEDLQILVVMKNEIGNPTSSTGTVNSLNTIISRDMNKCAAQKNHFLPTRHLKRLEKSSPSLLDISHAKAIFPPP